MNLSRAEIQMRFIVSQNQTVPPSQTLHEPIELKISEFYIKNDKSLPSLTLLNLYLQSVLLGRIHKPASQLDKATLLLLRRVSSSPAEPAKHGLQHSTICFCANTQKKSSAARQDRKLSVLLLTTYHLWGTLVPSNIQKAQRDLVESHPKSLFLTW